MSLLDSAYEDFIIVNKTLVPDGYGGVTPVWVDGTTIKGAMTFDSSTQMKVAQALGATSVYTFTVQKYIELDYHTVLKRASDDKVFRLTSDSDDKKTPEAATLDMRQYSAEEWQLT